MLVPNTRSWWLLILILIIIGSHCLKDHYHFLTTKATILLTIIMVPIRIRRIDYRLELQCLLIVLINLVLTPSRAKQLLKRQATRAIIQMVLIVLKWCNLIYALVYLVQWGYLPALQHPLDNLRLVCLLL